MKAYKIWHDQRYYIHAETTDQLHTYWTDDVKHALDIPDPIKADKFFYDVLGFSRTSRYDRLRLT